MKSSSSLIKILTLSFFVCTVIAFVTYKSGFFEETERIEETTRDNPSSMGSLSPFEVRDTLPDSLLRKDNPAIIPSSKSGMPFAPEDIEKSENENDLELIPSSKSGMPFPPEEETKKKKKRKKKKKIMSGSKSLSGVVETEEIIEKDSLVLIPSSKSAPIFEPQQQNQAPK